MEKLDKNEWKKQRKPTESINHWNESEISKKVEISSLNFEILSLKDKIKKFEDILENHYANHSTNLKFLKQLIEEFKECFKLKDDYENMDK